MAFNRKSVVDEIVEELERQIVQGELKPGQRIPEEALTKKWGVSRASLREAFRTLESQMFVMRQPGKGVSVSTITPETVREMYQVLAVLEGLACSLAIQNRSSLDIARLEDINQRMLSAAKHDDMGEYSRLNQLFHEEIIDTAENDFLISVLMPLNNLVKRFRAEIFKNPDSLEVSKRSHQSIIDALKQGSPKKAENQRRKTVLEIGELIAKQLARQKKIEKHR